MDERIPRNQAHRFPEFATFVARTATTQRLPGFDAARGFDEPDDRSTDERHAARLAEDAYRAGVMARHAAIFTRYAAGYPLQAWELRIVANRQALEAARAERRAA